MCVCVKQHKQQQQQQQHLLTSSASDDVEGWINLERAYCINSINSVCMTMMRPGLFFQREGPGSEPGNSLLCPDEASLRYLRGGSVSSELIA